MGLERRGGDWSGEDRNGRGAQAHNNERKGKTMETMKVKMVGLVDMLQHNVQLANPMSEATILLKAATKKGGNNKKPENYEEMARCEFMGGLYMNAGKYIIPQEQIEMMLACVCWDNFKISKASAVSCIEVNKPFILTSYDGPDDPEKRFGDPNCMDQRMVVVQKKKILRTRPRFSNWIAEGEVNFTQPMDDEKIKIAFEVAGQKGVGDYRPKFGRFVVEF